MEDLLFRSMTEVASLYRQKQLSPVEVLTHVFEQVEKHEPILNAFISLLHDEGMKTAKKAERLFLSGEEVHPLTGIPFSVKDLFYTKNIKTTCGSRILKQYIPNYTATVVERLAQTDAVLFGKTNMLEFAYGVVHPDYGQCNNPWDTTRTSGGSSSGSAAAVAAGMGYASLGTDTGGSIRIPASYCGVVGLKPTYGLISVHGVFPLSWSLDHVGPITRTVEDLALILDVITGYDPLDHYSVPSPRNYQNYRSHVHLEPSRKNIGIFPASMMSHVTPEVLQVYNNALRIFESIGWQIIEVDIQGLEQVEDVLMKVLLPEAAHIHRSWLDQKEEYAPLTYQQIELGTKQYSLDYLHGLEEMRRFKQAVENTFKTVDAILTPTVAFQAPAEDPAIGDGEQNEMTFTAPFNVSGHPALTINAGFTEELLPIGLQVVGKHFGEEEVLQIAYHLEQHLNLKQRPGYSR
jgi:aspartyl-tRNA(Asn)/glutamyl-tRNA(Gln) amidotransferase subunit A